MKQFIFVFSILLFSKLCSAQGNLLTLYESRFTIFLRDEIKGITNLQQHSALRHYYQHRISIKNEWVSPIINDNFEYFKLQSDSISFSSSKKFLKYFNSHPGHFYSQYGKHYYFTLDPVLNLSIGKEKDISEILFHNTRGINLRAGIDNKVFLFSRILETQISPVSYVHDFALLYKAMPGAGFVKRYKSSLFKINNGYDYLIAEGGLTFRASKHIDLSFAHSRNFIGQGVRSLLLSDFSSPMLNLRINTYLGRWNYQNIFSELSSETRFINDVDHLLQKKYSASHYLSCRITNNWNVGIFESVVFNRKKGFELQYLNPIILFRAIEQAVGSPDNVLIGLNSHLDIRKRVRLYGQLLLDEFVLGKLIKNEGWWANKYGIQLGFLYPDFAGIKNLNLQLEYNSVRPYTYSYSDSLANYSHYNQSLAHPLGSNFHEGISRISYQLNAKLNLSVDLLIYEKGLDNDTSNWGANILKPNSTREKDFNNVVGQGISSNLIQTMANVSYELFPRFWVDLSAGFRKNKIESNIKNTNWFQVGLRMNIDRTRNEF